MSGNDPPAGDETLPARSERGRVARISVLGEGIGFERELPVRGRLVIGRSQEADVVIDHPSVSREHVVLEVDESGVTIADLGSKNGTRLFGERLAPNTPAVLPSGVLAEVGEVVLVFRGNEGRASVPGQPAGEPYFGQALRPVLARVDKVAAEEIPVLFLGETGVGKQILAERLHARSGRKGPLLELHCAAIAPALFESEIFGYERGAFTGATGAKPGLLEVAHGGTVFIDEVGELPLDIQVKLLRVIEDKKVQRVGALKPRTVDVRFVAATNRQLADEVAAGRFRQDLYYRLGGVTIEIPPLRQRGDEIAVLARHFVEEASAARGRPAPRISAAALEALLKHDWPGNVRELRHTLQRAAILADRGEIGAEHIELQPRAKPASAKPEAAGPPLPGGDERTRILAALEQCAGNQTEAAKLLGISRRTLLYRLDEHGIPRPRKTR
jgi:DNA-binding NtrC family response regulator